MAVYVPTEFDGVTIASQYVRVTEIEETTRPIIRMGLLPTGVIFDADGATDSDVGLGQIIVVYTVTGAAKGVVALNTRVAALAALEGVVGVLVGQATAMGGPVTKTCTARCISVVTSRLEVRNSPPLHADYYQRQFVTMTFQKKTEWVA